MVPANVRVRRKAVEEKMKKLEEYADTFKYNVVEMNDTSVGVIASSAASVYKEVFPEWST